MALSRESWWPQASILQEGRRRRVNHDCGEGRTLLVSRGSDGYRAWCFRCNDGGGLPPPQESLSEKAARLTKEHAADTPLTEGYRGLPSGIVYDVSSWPDGAATWLYKAGLGRDAIGRLGIGFHPASGRVILPIRERGEPVFYQARAWQPWRLPKYLGPTPRPRSLHAVWGAGQVPTITEDILSAMKVGEVAEGWAAMGTVISAHMVKQLLERGSKANVWLDPDPAGRKGAARIIKQLRAYGIEVRNIVSLRDPKLHSREEIRSILES